MTVSGMYFLHSPAPRTDDATQPSGQQTGMTDHAASCQSAVLDELPHMVWMYQAEQPHGNLAWRDYTGGHIPQDWLELIHPEDQPLARQQWQQSAEAHRAFESQLRLRRHDGHYRWVLVLCRNPSPNAQAPRLLSFTDIHERVLRQAILHESSMLQTCMLDVSVDCIKILRPDGSLKHMNRSGRIALGVPEHETEFGMKWLDLLPAEIRPRGMRALQAARQGKNARFAGMSLAGDKPQHWDNILTPMKDEDGSTIGILCVSRDVTLQREAEKRLRFASDHDELTGLPNRRALKQRLTYLLGKPHAEDDMLGLLLLDLDHFKHVNDTLGHSAGDHLLRVLAKRLESLSSADCFVARLGGDEFAVLIQHLPDEAAVLQVAQQVRAQLHTPITYGGKPLNGGMSIGCAMAPRDATDAQSLMKKADTALNDIKANGRGGIRMFHPCMLEAAQRTATQLNQARHIVRNGNICTHYQPKVSLQDGRLLGFEALMRWHSPELGPQLPHTIEAAFDDYELATQLADFIQNQVLSDLSQWAQQGLPLVPVAINAAPVEFLRDDYAERLLSRLARYHIAPHWIEVEITEHMLADRGAAFVVRAAQQLKAAGVRIALDDFGTGHSSFTHLRDYPVHALKIDCEFVRRMEQESTIYAIVQAIAQLGPNLGLDVIAEGVETATHRHMLLEAGCTIGQGFLFSEALCSEAAAALMRRTPAVI